MGLGLGSGVSMPGGFEASALYPWICTPAFWGSFSRTCWGTWGPMRPIRAIFGPIPHVAIVALTSNTPQNRTGSNCCQGMC